MRNSKRKITMGRHLRPILAFSLLLLVLVAILHGGKPITFGPVSVELTGDITAGPKESFNAQFRSGKEDKVEIVVRNLQLTQDFARQYDFFENKYADPDGEVCFGEGSCDAGSGALRLFEDGSATLDNYPNCLTADGQDLQDYHIFLEGSWLGGGLNDLTDVLTAAGGNSFAVIFDRMEISAGGGKNRRKSCRGNFADGDGSGFTQVEAHVTF